MFQLSQQPIQPELLIADMQDDRAGALATFEGRVRNHNDGKEVILLEYEAYDALAKKEAERIIEESKLRYGILQAVCLHRVGQLKVGELSVWVGVTSIHRKEAFAACQYIIDELKTRVPIWKKEHYVDGSSDWVNCRKHVDDCRSSPTPVMARRTTT